MKKTFFLIAISVMIYVVPTYAQNPLPIGSNNISSTYSGNGWDLNMNINGVGGTKTPAIFSYQNGIIFDAIGASTYNFKCNGLTRMYITSLGNVGIGTTNTSGYKLSVNGNIRAKDMTVYVSWADYVFASDYKLKSIDEVESFIKENKHLPDVPSETEVLENGINVGEMNKILLQKIEELTLYMIELKKENVSIQAQLKELK
jgi:hypothetical protein